MIAIVEHQLPAVTRLTPADMQAALARIDAANDGLSGAAVWIAEGAEPGPWSWLQAGAM